MTSHSDTITLRNNERQRTLHNPTPDQTRHNNLITTLDSNQCNQIISNNSIDALANALGLSRYPTITSPIQF